MKKSVKFKVALLIQVLITVFYKLIALKGSTLHDILFWAVMGLGIYIFYMVFGYFCHSCKKNQIMKGFFSYRLPSDTCWHCGEKID
ncbi:hypothetical protein [Shewanella benthica]|nr:hypothetical protein [Shewanella benthica]